MTNKQIEALIDSYFKIHANCVQIPMMKLTYIYDEGRRAAKLGGDIEAAIVAAINKVRTN